MLREAAYAKVNLSLEVLGKRADGYHELISVFQTVDLADVISVSPNREIVLSSNIPGVGRDQNLAYRAASTLQSHFRVTQGCELSVEKHIPLAAGLGGGSSDAAATLLALRALWGLRVTEDELAALAASLGSDVPFFLNGGTALVEGRGEQVSPLQKRERHWYVLARPDIAVSTKLIFDNLPNQDLSDGNITRNLAAEMDTGLRNPSVGVNSLQNTLFRLFPTARVCYEFVAELAPGRTTVSGSGPTVVAVLDNEATARAMAVPITERGYWVQVCQDIQARGQA